MYKITQQHMTRFPPNVVGVILRRVSPDSLAFGADWTKTIGQGQQKKGLMLIFQDISSNISNMQM